MILLKTAGEEALLWIRNWEFRNKDGKDIYGEADFKKRFDCFSKNFVRSKKPFRPDF